MLLITSCKKFTVISYTSMHNYASYSFISDHLSICNVIYINMHDIEIISIFQPNFRVIIIPKLNTKNLEMYLTIKKGTAPIILLVEKIPHEICTSYRCSTGSVPLNLSSFFLRSV